jgi:hypothetical protein
MNLVFRIDRPADTCWRITWYDEDFVRVNSPEIWALKAQAQTLRPKDRFIDANLALCHMNTLLCNDLSQYADK